MGGRHHSGLPDQLTAVPCHLVPVADRSIGVGHVRTVKLTVAGPTSPKRSRHRRRPGTRAAQEAGVLGGFLGRGNVPAPRITSLQARKPGVRANWTLSEQGLEIQRTEFTKTCDPEKPVTL